MASLPPWEGLGCGPVPEAELCLDLTLPTGQSFRWRKTGEAQYTGVVGRRVVSVRQTPSDVQFRVHNASSLPGATAAHHRAALGDYFALSTGLRELYVDFAKRDTHFREVSPYFVGARMLRQDPLECLFSFICSSNNHISRIHGMVERLCSTYGTSLGLVAAAEGEPPQEYFAFPTLEQLMAATDDALRRDGFGYRAKFVVGTVAALREKHGGGAAWLAALRTAPYDHAVKELITLPGIGPKVAGCICLFSLDKHQAIPVDTHVWQFACRYYTPELTGKSVTPKMMAVVENAVIGIFGPYAGWAHNILFIAELASHRERLPEHLRPAVSSKKGTNKAKSKGKGDAEGKVKAEETLSGSPPKAKPSLAPPTPSPRAAQKLKRSAQSEIKPSVKVQVKTGTTDDPPAGAGGVRIPKKARRSWPGGDVGKNALRRDN